MNRRETRKSILLALGASPAAVEELLAYNENVFSHGESLPDDEPFVDAWCRYAREASLSGAFECLRQRLIQFRFPVRSGISTTDAYQKATRRGEIPQDGFMDGGLILADGAALRIEIHESAAGRIPLLVTTCRQDFVSLVRALTRKNEPDPVPDSMGACMVAGYNNWDRIRAYREAWRGPDALWPDEFKRLSVQKESYQDRFILLSDGPYSAVASDDLGLSEEMWRHYSLIIRREHECAHYYTRRILGSMRKNLLDEIIADYMGILAVEGRFRADWFLRFMGLERFPAYRSGGRLENYVDGLSEESFHLLGKLVVRAALNLERFGPGFDSGPAFPCEKTRILELLTSLTLEDMASAGFPGAMKSTVAE